MSIRKGKTIVATGGTSIKDQNNKRTLKFWSGTIEEYNSLPSYDDNTVYNITNDDINEAAIEIATTDSVGVVKPDGETIFVDEQGTLSGFKFTPIAPLAFETTTVEGLYNVSYDKETREATTDTYAFHLGNYSGDLSYITGRGSIGKDGSLICENYIDFPYKFGDILVISRFSSNCKVMFGYYNESNSFVPVTCNHNDTSNRLVTDSFRRFDTDYVYMPHLDTNSVTSNVKCGKSERAYQLFKDENETFIYSYQIDGESMRKGNIQTQYNSIVSKVNVVRINISDTTIIPILYSGNGTILNKFNFLDEITALPIVELKESSTGTILVDNSFGFSYNDLNNKPKVNGVEIKGDINISSLNVQDALTTKGPLKISKTGEWKAFNGEYNESTRQFELGGAYTISQTTSSTYDLTDIANYATNKTVVPIAGVVMPWYKNCTYVPHANELTDLQQSKCFLGVWDGQTFKPLFSLSTTYDYNSICRPVTSIAEGTSCTVGTAATDYTVINEITNYTDGLQAWPCVFMEYNNGRYSFKACRSTSLASRQLLLYVPTESETELLNQCNAIWMIGSRTSVNIGDGQASKLVQGDITEQLLMGKLDGTTFPAILPDNENYYTELSLNIDNQTIKLNEQNQLYADIQIPENHVTNEELEAKGYITLDAIQNKANKEDVYTKTELDGKLAGAFHYKGNVGNEQALPEQAEQGDVYNVLDTGANYAYTGSEWDKLSEVIDLSSVYTKEECDNKFTTLTEVNEQGFLIQSDLSDYAKSSDIPTDFYTKQEVDNKIGNAIISGELDLSEYAKVQDVNNSLELKANVSDTYNKTEVDNLIGNIQLPEDVVTESTLESKGYVTQSDIQTELDNKQDKGDYALTSAIPTKVSQLTNDAGYITEQIDISGKADKSDTYTKQEVDNKFTEFNPDLSSCYTKEQTDSLLANKANTSDIPDTSSFATTSELSNKQDKLTPGTGISIQNNVITCTVQQQDLSNYYTKAQIDTMIGNIDNILDYILGV